MKKFGRCYLMLLMLFTAGKLLAQSPLPSIQVPVIQPPSLTAQAFMRYGEIPIDYSTGVPGISIPLYTVKGKKLELPISLSYHASGIKVNDVASEVGLGWVLNCGGMVSRTIFGERDESNNSIHTYTTAQQMYDTINYALTQYDPSCQCYHSLWDFNEFLKENFYKQDPQSDRFFYCLPNGTSGVFRYDLLNPDTIIKLPSRPLKIEKELSGNIYSGYSILRIKITDENGIVYTYEPYLQNVEFITNSSDFYLTRMLSPDGKDSIKITYDVTTPQPGVVILSNAFIGPIKYFGYGEECADMNNPLAYDLLAHLSNSCSYYFEAPKINTIETSLSTIYFNYNNDRSDFNFMHRLNNITIVSNTDNSTLKTIAFSPKYFGSGNSARLGLDSVKISSPGNNNPEVYTFKYENQVLPAYTSKLPFYDSYNEDFWGYNNNSNSPSLIPGDLVPAEYKTSPTDFSYLCGNRDPDTVASKACMIKEIKYPTGGRTVFKFERNFANNVYPYKSNPDGFVGGYRVQSISDYDENNKQAGTRTYEYYIAIARPITWNLFRYSAEFWYNNTRPCDTEGCNWMIYCILNYYRDMVSSSPFLPLEVAVGLPVVYTEVVEYNGTRTNNTGKTVYKYNLPFSPNDIYDNPNHPAAFEEPWYIHPFHWDKGNYVLEMVSKFEYSFDGQNYHPVAKTYYTYSKLFTKEFQTGIQLTKLKDYLYLVAFQYGSVDSYEYPNKIVAIDTKAYQEASLLTHSENNAYNPSDSTKYIVSTTDLEYDSTYLQLKKRTVSTSIENTSRVTEYKYPFDNIADTTNKAMVDQNKISAVIEQTDKINNTMLQTTKTNYKAWDGNKIIAPETIETTRGTQTETRIRYKYDTVSGNLNEASKENDVKSSYIWGYNQTYPVVKGENIDQSTLDTAVINSLPPGFSSLEELLTAEDGIQDMILPEQINLWKIFHENLRGQSSLIKTMVTCYTYSPLIGMTSQTDPNGITTYYEYDTFGRLKRVKDQNGKILKEYDYHYKQ